MVLPSLKKEGNVKKWSKHVPLLAFSVVPILCVYMFMLEYNNLFGRGYPTYFESDGAADKDPPAPLVVPPPLTIDTTPVKPRVSCGNHQAKSCSKCVGKNDGERGDSVCNGECFWFDNKCREITVSCGGHRAVNCQTCPFPNHGAAWCNGDCEWDLQKGVCVRGKRSVAYNVHPAIELLLQEYPFQEVRTDTGERVNILLVRSPMNNGQLKLYEQFKNDILFLGISSFESYPLASPNPFSNKFDGEKYKSLLPGFLTMMRKPEEFFEPHVKTILLSQSDFSLDYPLHFNKDNEEKLYDFTYSGNDQNVDTDCVGWGAYAKNWSFAAEALELFCSRNMTGVLVATAKGNRSCALPPACNGKNMIQTLYLPNQTEFYDYVRHSRFLFLPQIYDASPRVATQALAMNVPLLMNRHIVGGWKYLNNHTGEFFTDMRDLEPALDRILSSSQYQPREWVKQNAGNEIAGQKLKAFVEEHFSDRVLLPKSAKMLLI